MSGKEVVTPIEPMKKICKTSPWNLVRSRDRQCGRTVISLDKVFSDGMKMGDQILLSPTLDALCGSIPYIY